MATYTLNDLKALTLDQYDGCKAKALERTQRRIGERPTRRQFERELGRLWTVLDILALFVFIPALVVSSIHIISHMGKLAEASYAATGQAAAGTIISQDLFVAAHQWMLIPLAEGSMILFTVLFGLTRANWRRWVFLALAAVAVTFVLVANWQSGIGLLESVLAPLFTIGIGFKLEHLIVQAVKRRKEVDDRYLTALDVWEKATTDATQHPDYPAILKQEIWQAIVKLKANQAFADAPSGFKHAAVRREQARDQWAYGEEQTVMEFQAEEQEKASKSPAAKVPFGNTALEVAESAAGTTGLNEIALTTSNGSHA